MILPNEKKKKWNYLGLAFAIPCLGMLFVMLISKYEPFGAYSMLYSDMYHQYYPFFVDFRRSLLSGNGVMYNWSVGMGMDYLGLIAYYLASPLNLLSVLVPESLLLEYFSLLMPIKLGFAGLFFAIFLKRMFDKDDFSICVFGGLYGLCAWALGFQWNIMWLDTFALLPLVALGTVALLRDQKFILYTLSLFLSIFANYYIGFFTCIFVFLLFFIYQFCRWGGWRKFVEDLFRIALFSLLAIGMTAILELPAFLALQTTQSSVNQFPTTFRLNMTTDHTLRGLFIAMCRVAGNMGGSIEPNFKEGLPNVYCGIISIFLMFLYLQTKEIKTRDKICSVGLLLFFNASFVIRQLDYIWHGFHFTNMIPYRFSFLYSFVVLYMAYRAWLMRRKYKIRQIVIAGLLSVAVLVCSDDLYRTIPVSAGSMKWDFPIFAVYNLVFLALYMLSFVYGALPVTVPADAEQSQLEWGRVERGRMRVRSRQLVLGIVCLELVANLICFGLYFTGTSVNNYPKGTTYTESVIRYMHEREEGNLFYRAETTHSQTLNDGALNGYRGISTFTSSANVKTTLFMQALGYGAKNTYNRYLFEESSPVANLFLGLKYMIERDGQDKTSSLFEERNHYGDTILLENMAYLPLGFLAQPELADVNFGYTGNAFVFQNELFTAATGIAEEVWYRIPVESTMVTGEGVTVQKVSIGGYCQYTDATANSNLYFNFVADRDGFACLHLNLPQRNTYYVSINGVELFRESISLPQMIAVGDVKAGDVIGLRIVCTAGEESSMTAEAAVLNMDRFWQGYEILNASTLELTSFKPTRVEGTVSCNRDGLLYTSIPQNGGWSVYVDGEPAQIRLVGDCMVAVELTAGVHDVQLRYYNQAFSQGWKMSLTSVVAFLLLIRFYYPPRKKKVQAQPGNTEE